VAPGGEGCAGGNGGDGGFGGAGNHPDGSSGAPPRDKAGGVNHGGGGGGAGRIRISGALILSPEAVVSPSSAEGQCWGLCIAVPP
jgi:hypothetical protein